MPPTGCCDQSSDFKEKKYSHIAALPETTPPPPTTEAAAAAVPTEETQFERQSIKEVSGIRAPATLQQQQHLLS
jgi:hypothetical protein